jgi:Fe-S cluster assembly ATP-binding protein
MFVVKNLHVWVPRKRGREDEAGKGGGNGNQTGKATEAANAEKEIVHGVSFSLSPGSLSLIMGPNGSGKSSLCNALMGDPAFHAKGSIRLDGAELAGAGPDVRAKKGLFLSFQNPEEVEGVKVSNFMRRAVAAKEGTGRRDVDGGMDALVKSHERLLAEIKKLGMDGKSVTRELNVGFSGGEKKRLELLQMLMLRPKVAVLDEIDSGLDVDGIKLIARTIRTLRNSDRRMAILMVTHYPRILKYLKPDAVHVLAGGRIVRSGTAALAREIEKKGYARYVKADARHAGARALHEQEAE